MKSVHVLSSTSSGGGGAGECKRVPSTLPHAISGTTQQASVNNPNPNPNPPRTATHLGGPAGAAGMRGGAAAGSHQVAHVVTGGCRPIQPRQHQVPAAGNSVPLYVRHHLASPFEMSFSSSFRRLLLKFPYKDHFPPCCFFKVLNKR